MNTKPLPPFLLVFVCTFFSLSVFAFRLDPMVIEFSPSGKAATHTVRVENDGQDKIAVKIQMYRRLMDEKGVETREPTEDFKVYPAQFSLNAKDSRSIRVIYNGEKNLEREQSYRLVATQLPVDFKEETRQSGVKFLFEFVASVYVTQPKFFPVIEVESIKASESGATQLTVVNSGTRHKLLRHVNIHLQDTQGRPLVVNEKVIQDWNGENLLAGARRVFNFKSNSQFNLKNRPARVEMLDAD